MALTKFAACNAHARAADLEVVTVKDAHVAIAAACHEEQRICQQSQAIERHAQQQPPHPSKNQN